MRGGAGLAASKKAGQVRTRLQFAGDHRADRSSVARPPSSSCRCDARPVAPPRLKRNSVPHRSLSIERHRVIAALVSVRLVSSAVTPPDRRAGQRHFQDGHRQRQDAGRNGARLSAHFGESFFVPFVAVVVAALRDHFQSDDCRTQFVELSFFFVFAPAAAARRALGTLETTLSGVSI